MRVLAIYKYYWPDTTPYARILKGILESWCEDGHQAMVLTAQPGYNDIRHPRQPSRETLSGVEVIRVSSIKEKKGNSILRVLSFLSFLGLSIFRACTGPKADLIIVNPHPPVLMGLAVRLIRFMRGIPYIYHCEDIHPESSLAAGKMNEGMLFKTLRSIDTASCQNAALVVTLSEDMVWTLRNRGVEEDRVEVINNYILGEDELVPVGPSILRKDLGNFGDKFVLLFAGNIGLFQGLDHFIHTARILADRPEIIFYFMGEGAAKAQLKALAGDLLGRTVFFSPFQPLPVARQAMEEADLSLVSLEPGVFRVAYPSKTMNCLAAGSPVLAIVEAESRLATDLKENNLGYCCAQGDYEYTAEVILAAYEGQMEWRGERARISKWAQDTFGRDHILKMWSKIPYRALKGRDQL